ncbi:uncharacterized protein K460DRAFT_39443 [Cucurbitaria berberidis CBS 394.84]|uniref:Uncharacterized protein n=1 Tax=Cucurbitaria berberidis CBS 394.84 TaxID=1168544 RepID=A0A9P4LE54_9PLEO|nr:uncharacterized protein K460DRAFT_39443 [Cucurbitaria berberidis CBS 394.84]KAF1851690.1 hypothetical protein K460DRAFT_39443 [Cucurbitaria berberidis CBS 394.84]
MRATYTGASQKLGKSHPQSPPLHLHFDQFESFYVGAGKVGTTDGWAAEDRVWTREDAPLDIKPWEPHRFWPCPDAEEDSVLYLWAHPTGTPEPMDRMFFDNLLRYLSDVTEKKASLSLLQVMVMQHATASALVMFPTAWWLGPIRWWVPWTLQRMCAWVGRCCGYMALMEQYTDQEEWKDFLRAKKA